MKIRSQSWLVLLYMLFHISCNTRLCVSIDNLTIGESISGNQTLISQNGRFELGFFTPSKTSNKYYIGIWYKHDSTSIRTVVWVANRYHGITKYSYSSEFELSKTGIRIKHEINLLYWDPLKITYAVAVLHNDGNFVIRGWGPYSSNVILLQSFDDPIDTWLPGAKLGRTDDGKQYRLTSWKSAEDPDLGYFRLQNDEHGNNLVITNLQTGISREFLSSSLIVQDKSLIKYIAFFIGVVNGVVNVTHSNAYFTYSVHNTSIPTRMVLDPLGRLQLFMWMEDIGKWDLVFQHPELRSTNGVTKRRILVVSIVIGTITVIGILVMFMICIRKRRVRESNVAVSEGSLVLYKYRDLMGWTMNFSMELGRGGFGTVYRGTMSDSTPVAVKKLEYFTREKHFRSEVNTIGLVQHVNLIRLLGFCAEGSKRLLVYEYMPNGSLGSYLFRKDSTILDWNMRYRIALGVARGLQYLHKKGRDRIIHCDIKPENILLDATLNAKVADFGLAKLLGRDFSRVLTTMKGTRGYLAPEWLSGVPITPKVDIYSYGMMLFEIISGRRNLDMVNEDMSDYFPARAAEITNKGEELLCVLDQRLDGNANVEELKTACRVACWCIQDDERERPSMGHVVHALEGLSAVGIPPIPSFLQVILHGSESTKNSTSTLPNAGMQSNDSVSLEDESMNSWTISMS